MGNHISVDTSPIPLSDLVSSLNNNSSDDEKQQQRQQQQQQSSTSTTVTPSGTDNHQHQPFTSNIKVWSFKPRKNDPLETDVTPVDFSNGQFASFDSKQCYILLHLFQQQRPNNSNNNNNNNNNNNHDNNDNVDDTNKLQSSLLRLAVSTSEQLTPRGTEHKFSTRDLHTIFFNKIYTHHNHTNHGKNNNNNHPDGKNNQNISGHADDDDGEVNYDLYLWHGKASTASTQAFTITKGFELERKLLNKSAVQRVFHMGQPTVITRYFVDDIPPVRSKSDALYKSSSSSVALFMSLYQHCHLFRTLANIDSRRHYQSQQQQNRHVNRHNSGADNNGECCDEQSMLIEPAIAFRSLLQMPPGDNNESFGSIDDHMMNESLSSASDDDESDDDGGNSRRGNNHDNDGSDESPVSSPIRLVPSTNNHQPLTSSGFKLALNTKSITSENNNSNNNNNNNSSSANGTAATTTTAAAKESRFDRSTSYSQVLPTTFQIKMANIPTGMPSLNLPSPRKRPPPEGIKTSDSKRQLKTLSSIDSQSTPRSVPSSLPSSSRSMSSERLRVNLGSVELGERHDPSPTPRRMQQQTLPERCLSGNELVVYYRKVCSQIYDYVYLGSDLVARNKDILQKNGITHIVNAAKVVCDVYFPDDFTYHVLNLYDAGNESILGTFFGVIDFIEKARKNGGKVYIHCYEGVSRSTTLTIAYLMWRLKKKFNTVMEEVKLKRPVASPNPGFIVQLIQWEKMILEPQTTLFRISPQNDRYAEHKHCVPKLCYANSLDTRTCFILHSSPMNIIFLWVGTESQSTIVEAQKFVHQLKKYMGDDDTNVKIIYEGQETSEFEAARSVVKTDSKVMLGDATNPYPDLDYLTQELDARTAAATAASSANSSTSKDDEDHSDDGDEELEYADLYVYPDMDMIDNFDSEDLNEDEAYVLQPRSNNNTLYVWVGEGFAESCDKSTLDAGQSVARAFIKHKQLSSENTVVVIVQQDEEPEEFWKYFVNG